MQSHAKLQTTGVFDDTLGVDVARRIEAGIRSGARGFDGTRLLGIAVAVVLGAWCLGLAGWVWVHFSGWATIP